MYEGVVMANPIKVFISSVAQDQLSQVRTSVFNELKSMEHQPIMYERNIGPWPQHQAVERCMEAVSESDIFILFISNKAGTYYEEYGATVTHLEFLQAYKENKIVLPFIEQDILQLFWQVKNDIEEKIKTYIEKNGQHPDSYKEIAFEVWENHHLKSQHSHIDYYVFGFLYDIYIKGYYFEKVTFGQDPIRIIKKYFSDLFRKGSSLIRIAATIEDQAIMAELHQKHTQFSNKLLDLLKNGEIINYRMFLAHIQSYMTGGHILYKMGTVFEEEVGQYSGCIGTTLYKKSEHTQELVFIESSGTASDDNKKYLLNDSTSFVVQAFLDEAEEQLFFHEDKQQLYYIVKINNYALCLHYSISPYFSEQQMNLFKNDVFSAILESESELYRGFVKKLLGGMK